jgi:peptide/nickel transport system substrate-binding protein
MLETLRNNVGKAANSGITPIGLPTYNDSIIGYKFDLNKAKNILKELSFENNSDSPLILYTNQDYLDICTFVARQWESIGITTEIELLESSILRNRMRSGDVGLFRASWIADYPDAESFFCLFYSKNPAPPNYTRFSNLDYDKLYDSAVIESHPGKKIELYHKMEKLLIEEAPVIFLFYDETALFTSKRTSGISNNGLNLLQVKSISVN